MAVKRHTSKHLNARDESPDDYLSDKGRPKNPGHDPLPLDIEGYIERINKWMAMPEHKGVEFDKKFTTKWVSGVGYMCEQINFIDNLLNMSKEGLKFTQEEVTKLADHFKYREDDGKKFFNLHDFMMHVQEQFKHFNDFVEQFTTEMEMIRERLRRSNTMSGVFSWFKNNSRDGREVTFEEFSKALDKLSLNSIGQADRERMFNILDFDKSKKVPVITISNAFNFFDKQNRKQNTASIEEICSKILMAFNVDESYLEQNIPSLK